MSLVAAPTAVEDPLDVSVSFDDSRSDENADEDVSSSPSSHFAHEDVQPAVEASRSPLDDALARRIDQITRHLSPNARGDFDVGDVIKVLIGAGIDRNLVSSAFPGSEAQPTTSSQANQDAPTAAVARVNTTISDLSLKTLLRDHFGSVIMTMQYFDTLRYGNEESRAVAASRLVIASRIDDMTQKAKSGDTQMRITFDFVHMFSIVFVYVMTVVYNLTFFDVEPVIIYWIITGSHALWMIDLIWNISLPCMDKAGNLITDTLGIVRHKRYVLAIDAITLCPLDLILFWKCEPKDDKTFLPFDDQHPILLTFIAWRLLKIIKITRLASLFTIVTLDVITPWFVTIFFLFKPLLHVISIVIIVVQTITCVCLHVFKQSFSDPPAQSFIDQLVDVVSMLTGSGPGVTFDGPEGKVVELALIAFGLIAQAAVISNLTVTVFRNDVNALNVQQMRETLGILEHFRVPSDVGTEILSYQLHALNDDVSRRISTLQTLPIEMQKEVMLYVKVAAVNTVKLFSKATHDCKMKIADSLIQTVVAPNTDIVAIGDIGEEMFLIAHGYASVIIFNGVTVAMLSRGDYFGEVALLLPNNVRQATVRALTYCDLWVLDKPAFLFILQEFPGLLVSMEDDLKAKGIKIDPLELLAKKPPEGGEPGPMSPPHSSSNPIGSSPFEDDLRRVSAVNPMHHGLITSHQALRVTDEDDEDTTPIFDAPPPNATAFNSTRGLEPSMFEQSVNYMNHTFTGHGRHRKSRASILTISGGGVASRAVPFPASSFLQSPSGGDHLTRLHGQLSSMESFSPVTSQISNQMVVHPSSVRRSMSPPSPSRLEEQHRSREASSQIASFALGGSGVGVTVGGGESTNALQNRIQALELELWNLARDVQDLVGKV